MRGLHCITDRKGFHIHNLTDKVIEHCKNFYEQHTNHF